MKFRYFTTVLLAAVAFAACSESAQERVAVPDPADTRVTLQRDGMQDVTVYAFRRQDDAFLYDTFFRDGWTPDGTLSVRMPAGQYKFLFVSGAGENLALEPAPLTGQTTWEQTAFTLREDPAAPGMYLPADDLFLQFPAADADAVYTLGGADVTVSARLTRAVSRIGVTVKRGYHDGTGYVEVPYTPPYSVLDEIDRIELTAANAGLRVGPGGSEGTASVRTTLASSDYAELTGQGFVRLEGPLVIPPAGGEAIDLLLSVVPATGATLQPTQLRLAGKAERNKRLDVTLWITSGYPVIGVEIDVAPIDREQEGDWGIWE